MHHGGTGSGAGRIPHFGAYNLMGGTDTRCNKSRRKKEMEITRTFLGWDGPILPRVVGWLGQRYGNSSALDLSQVCVVVPGGRAGRRLLELLVLDADERGIVFLPPRIKTLGDLPELFYQPQMPFAGRLTQHLAWLHVLRTCDRGRLQRFVKQLPTTGDSAGGAAETDLEGWLRLARLLWRQHRELAGDGLSFQDVVDYGQQTQSFYDTERWQFLRELQLAYLAQLDRCQLWDRQTARLYAIKHRECHAEGDIVLVAMVDMNRATRLMLDQVASRVTALIAAPSEMESRFDRHGCLVSAAWTETEIDILDDQIQVADGADAQAAMVVDTVAGYSGRYRADEITIGLPDAALAQWIENSLARHDLPARHMSGRPIRQTTAFKIVEAIADYLHAGSYESFAAIVRHPLVIEWLDRQWISTESSSSSLHSQLDRFHNDMLPVGLIPRSISPKRFPLVREALAAWDEAVLPLRCAESDVGSLPLNAWPQRIVEVLDKFYGEVVVERNDPEWEADVATLGQIHDGLMELHEIPSSLAPIITGSQAIALLLHMIESEHCPPVENVDALTMTGWLELPLDPSPALIVTSFNEEFLPESLDSDLFMPNRLRQELGLVDNTRRYVRDAYALSVLAHTRDSLTVIAARRDTEGNPLKPSRLLFATDEQTMARRALSVFRPCESEVCEDSAVASASFGGVNSVFDVSPPPPLAQPVTTLTVTSFRSYLACPYRFYLSHIAKLEEADDRRRELDAPQFGNLIHEVLCRFGRHEVRHSEEEEAIREFLDAELRKCAWEWFGSERMPAVNLQIGQAGARLHAFAKWQAGWARQGWRIRHTEVPEDDRTVPWETPAGIIRIRGRIDRIDYHEPTGRWMVFDYKTGDTAKRPEQTHRSDGRWTDLQLPLYRHIVQLLGITDPVLLGYILLSKDPSQTGEYGAVWSESELGTADAQVDEVVRSVLAERFWPPAVPAPRILREFAILCNEGILA